MRILYACWLDPATTDLPLSLARAWEKAGHEVCLFPADLEFYNRTQASLRDWLALNVPRLRMSVFEHRLESKGDAFQPDVLLFGNPFIVPNAMKRLREKWRCTLGYFIGYNNLLEESVAESIRLADFLIVHDSYLVPLLQGSRYGRVPNVFLLDCFANPDEHFPAQLSESDRNSYGSDIVFIGGIGPNRVEALRPLRRYGLRIWGDNRWAQVQDLTCFYRDEPVYGLKKTKIYAACKIVLNIEDSEKQINAISNRVPEVLACGGFVITEWHKDLERTSLVDGQSIATFRTLHELQEKVTYYLHHPEHRKRISENGREVVLRSLTHHAVAIPLIEQVENLVKADRSSRSKG